MRILLVGDIHNKPHIFDKAFEIADNRKSDKIVFIGDYFDDWVDSAESTFDTVMALNDAMNDPRVVALIGNHELSYINGQRCSGWTAAKDMVINANLNKSKLALSYQVDNWLFSHAGLTRDWYKYANNLNIRPGKDDPVYVQHKQGQSHADWLNELWQRYPGIYRSVGRERGGFGIGSPLWADWEELKRNRLKGINQVVGHSPQAEITRANIGRDYLINIDVWSNDGLGGFLEWMNGKIKVLDNTGSPIVNPFRG